MVSRFAACLMFATALIACAPDEPDGPSSLSQPAFQLPQPNVTIAADPAPPLTYWAPEGSTIVNHPDVPGIWFAELNGQRVETYFGDACRASEYQRFVGQPLTSMVAVPEGVEERRSCTTCPVNGDLRANRMNVLFNEQSRAIEKIACY